MKNVYLFEINDIIANQIKLPYSTGLIWSHCLLNEEIKNNYDLADWFYYREDQEDILAKVKDPYIIGFNCFVWNYKYNKQVAEEIKRRFPDCIIVFGGWQQPIADRSQGFFEEHPYVDVIVHGEGEIAFEEILVEALKDKPDWKSITGCSIPNEDLSTFVTPPRPRIANIDEMPSPYLDGLFDRLLEKADHTYALESTIETTRGCPYSCTFCEIGTKYYSKVRRQSFEKVKKEIDWISDHKVEFIYNADSNFGMFPEHLDVTRYMVDKKKETGYPGKHRCDWAKNKGDKVIPLAKIFTEADMDKGITIALQSMNPKVLKAIKRQNIDSGKLERFLEMYNEEELTSYVELILGLPEETTDSFMEGVCKTIELGQHNYIGIYSLTALPNTPFGDPEYIKEYGLKVLNTYTAFNHYDITDENEFEREDMIVASNAMSFEEYKQAHLFRWTVMYGHYLGTIQYISRYLRSTRDITYREFYESFLKFMSDNPDTFVGQELQKTISNLDAVLDVKQPWGRIVEDVRKNFAWDFEEATAIECSKNKEQFYSEIQQFLLEQFNIEYTEEISELFKYQILGLVDPQKSYPFEHTFKYNIHNVIHKKSKPQKNNTKVSFDAENYNGDYYKWGVEKLWWGRRVGACKAKTTYVK